MVNEQSSGASAYEEAVAAARAAGRCPKCVLYGVRPGLVCIDCGTGDRPYETAAEAAPAPR